MSKMVELWTTGGSPRDIQLQATTSEADGWDGMNFSDTQNLSGDPYAAVAVAAGVTSTLKFGTGMTNPFTRHPATAACAAATVQSISGGRFVFGIGRGDSSNAYVGFAPSSVRAFEHYVDVVRRYLHRIPVPFDDLDNYGRGAGLSPADTLHLGGNVEASRLEWWLPLEHQPPVVEVAATGPRVLEMAGRVADSVALSVGADPARVKWAADVAMTARRRTSDDWPLHITAFVPVVCSEDEHVALELIRGPVASMARFSVMYGAPVGPLTEHQLTVVNGLNGNYDMTHHSQGVSTPASLIDLEFARSYAVFGSPEACTARLLEIAAAGVTRIVLIRPDPITPLHLTAAHVQLSNKLIVEEVLPAVRAAKGAPA
jgi:5,10-methylenetetrahydromethanopterin reductase